MSRLVVGVRSLPTNLERTAAVRANALILPLRRVARSRWRQRDRLDHHGGRGPRHPDRCGVQPAGKPGCSGIAGPEPLRQGVLAPSDCRCAMPRSTRCAVPAAPDRQLSPAPFPHRDAFEPGIARMSVGLGPSASPKCVRRRAPQVLPASRAWRHVAALRAGARPSIAASASSPRPPPMSRLEHSTPQAPTATARPHQRGHRGGAR